MVVKNRRRVAGLVPAIRVVRRIERPQSKRS